MIKRDNDESGYDGFKNIKFLFHIMKIVIISAVSFSAIYLLYYINHSFIITGFWPIIGIGGLCYIISKKYLTTIIGGFIGFFVFVFPAFFQTDSVIAIILQFLAIWALFNGGYSVVWFAASLINKKITVTKCLILLISIIIPIILMFSSGFIQIWVNTLIADNYIKINYKDKNYIRKSGEFSSQFGCCFFSYENSDGDVIGISTNDISVIRDSKKPIG